MFQKELEKYIEQVKWYETISATISEVSDKSIPILLLTLNLSHFLQTSFWILYWSFPLNNFCRHFIIGRCGRVPRIWPESATSASLYPRLLINIFCVDFPSDSIIIFTSKLIKADFINAQLYLINSSSAKLRPKSATSASLYLRLLINIFCIDFSLILL